MMIYRDRWAPTSASTPLLAVGPPPGGRIPALHSWKARGPTESVPQRMVLRNNMRSDFALRAELRERMRAAHHAPRSGTQPAAAQTGESVSTTPRQPPPPPRPRSRDTHGQREAPSTPAQVASSSSSSSSEQQAPLQARPPGPEGRRGKLPVPKARPTHSTEEVGATPQEGFSMGSMATVLQQASEETPDFAGPPENPASPSRSEPQAETVESPTSPAVAEVCTETSQTPLQVQTMAKVVDSTPPASERSSDDLPPEQQSLQVPAGSAADDAAHTAEGGSTTAALPARETHAAGEPKRPQAAEGSASEAAKGAPHCGPSGQALGSLEVECREALRTQWLSFPFDPEATAASTLAH